MTNETPSPLIQEPRAHFQRLIATWKQEDPESFLADHRLLPERLAQSLAQELPNIENQIPELLRADAVDDGQLIRFKCLIQDNGFQNEIYPLRLHWVDAETSEEATTFNCFHEFPPEPTLTGQVELDQTRCVFADKFPFYAVSVPGQSAWSRRRGDDTVSDDLVASMAATTISQDADASLLSPVGAILKKYPLPWEAHQQLGVLLKTYHPADWKLNETVEVIGIVEKQPQQDPAEGQSTDSIVPLIIHVILYRPMTWTGGHASFQSLLSDCGRQFHPVGTLMEMIKSDLDSMLTRAHTANSLILKNELQRHHSHDCSMTEIRGALVQWLRDEVFFGDELVSEYVLLWLLSRIYKRSSDVTLGHFSLNITDCPVVEKTINAPNETKNLFVERVYTAIQMITTHCALIPLNLELLNSVSFSPKFNPGDMSFESESTGSVEAGLLQLASGTCLIIDETSMDSGQLKEKGIRNLAALQQLLTFNTIQLESDLQTPIMSEVDVKCLVLSEGRQSLSASNANEVKQTLLPTSASVPFRPTQEVSSSSLMKPIKSDALLPLFRLYIAYSSVAGEASHFYSVPEDLTTAIAREFSEQRKKARESSQDQYVSDEDLLYRLGLARLIAVSNGEKMLTKDIWDSTKQLEHCRSKRMAPNDAPMDPVGI